MDLFFSRIVYFHLRLLLLASVAGSTCLPLFSPLYANNCVDYVRVVTQASLPRVWDTRLLSDPAQHNHNNYLYAVHAANEKFLNVIANMQTTELGKIKDIVFSSLVTNDKPRTFNDVGFILEFGPEHVVGTSPYDTATEFVSTRDNDPASSKRLEDQLQGYAQKYPIQSPEHILRKTGDIRPIHNELVLRGVSAVGAPVRIKGVFVWGDKHGHYPVSATERKTAELAAAYAHTHNLPVVVFRAPVERFADQPLTEFKTNGQLERIVLQTNFERHEMIFNGEGNFYSHTRVLQNEVRVSHLPTYTFEREVISRAKTDPSFADGLRGAYLRIRSTSRCDGFCRLFFSRLQQEGIIRE